MLIEKLSTELAGAVLLREFEIKICWFTIEQGNVLSKKLFEDLFVQSWVAELINGGNDELAESLHIEGKVT